MSARPRCASARVPRTRALAGHHLQALLAAHGAPAVRLSTHQDGGDVQKRGAAGRPAGAPSSPRKSTGALPGAGVIVAVRSLKGPLTWLDPGLHARGRTAARRRPRRLLSRDGARLAATAARRARVGTSGLRRRAPLMRAADLTHAGCAATCRRGLNACAAFGDYDAIILAAAGLARLQLLGHVGEFLSPGGFPARSLTRGVISVCAYRGRPSPALAAAGWPRGRASALHAERCWKRTLRGRCRVPLGALASRDRPHARARCRRLHALDGGAHLGA